ncbi:hypothetical protein KM176_06305 [Pseudooceanicola sp. CBS1P-1]|uniref:Uncharacterized protein n=1 Tax=Pseudooceanicola albus TaxID=2692189 RepID=A0A6L7FVT4_9RHOB|nr:MULTISPECIES: hypothetical protein [Pseudooceanicola]MBT9383464.1 hypothetical protein [Pseudooceanicola endophyticus]MXN16214.1 hypothetical protein [Pseudooceanicola albus]
MPRLVRLYILQCLIGFAISALFTAGLIVFDVMGLKHLILGSRDGWLGAFLIFFSNGIVFAGVQFAITIMGMAEGEGPRGGRRFPLRILRAQPVRVAASGAEKRRARTQPFE